MIAASKYRRCRSSIVLGILISYNYLLSVRKLPDPPVRFQTSKWMDAIASLMWRLFQERGYTAVAMRDIAEAAGMRTASLYYHFPSKEELFVSVRGCLSVIELGYRTP